MRALQAQVRLREHDVTRRGWIWLLTTVLAGAMVAFAPIPARASQPAERLIHVDASQFSYSPGEIHVNQGDHVTIELASTDVVHGLYVDGYGASVTADPGQPARLTFTADRAGSFRFRCNVTCGAMHPFMIGKLMVGRDDRLPRAMGLAALAALSLVFMPRKVS